MTVSERLELIDKLRARGARIIEISGDSVKVVFDGPAAPKGDEIPEDAKAEYERRLKEQRKPRSLEDRLFKPLGIDGKKGDAA